MELTPSLRRLLRRLAGQSGSRLPIEIVDGESEPQVVGECQHWRNARGDTIRFPNAYRKFGRPIYIASTKRITVGSDWLVKNSESLTHESQL